MKHFFIILSVIFLVFFNTAVFAQNTWSLQKCIDYALENNIQIKQQDLNTKTYENQVNQAKSNLLPDLNAQFSNNYSFGRTLTYPGNTYVNTNSTSLSGGIGANFTIFNGFTLRNEVKRQQLDFQATLKDFQKAKDDIMLNIAAAYLEILFAEEVVTVSQAQIEVTKQQINRTQQLVDAGSLAKGSLLEIQAQQAREDLQLVNDQNSVQLAYLTLYQLLDLPITKNFKVEKPVLPEIKANMTMYNSLDIFNNAMNSRPEIQAAQLRVKSAESQLEIAKGSRYPTLTFGANYYNTYNHYNSSDALGNPDAFGSNVPFNDQLKSNGRSSAGFTLNIPIFNQFQVKNSISNAYIRINNYKYQLQTASNVLRKEIEQAYTNALAALNRYNSTQKAVVSMEEAFRYVEEKYNVGMVNSVEYNQSKNDLTAAKSQLLQAKYEYIFRTKILDFYNGNPIEL